MIRRGGFEARGRSWPRRRSVVVVLVVAVALLGAAACTSSSSSHGSLGPTRARSTTSGYTSPTVADPPTSVSSTTSQVPTPTLPLLTAQECRPRPERTDFSQVSADDPSDRLEPRPAGSAPAPGSELAPTRGWQVQAATPDGWFWLGGRIGLARLDPATLRATVVLQPRPGCTLEVAASNGTNLAVVACPTGPANQVESPWTPRPLPTSASCLISLLDSNTAQVTATFMIDEDPHVQMAVSVDATAVRLQAADTVVSIDLRTGVRHTTDAYPACSRYLTAATGLFAQPQPSDLVPTTPYAIIYCGSDTSVIYNLDTDTPVGGPHHYMLGGQHFSQPDADGFWVGASPGLQHLTGADLHTDVTVAEPPSNGPFASFSTMTPGLVSATDLWQIGCTSRPSPNDPCLTSPLVAIVRRDVRTGALARSWLARGAVADSRAQVPNGVNLESADATGLWYTLFGALYRLNR